MMIAPLAAAIGCVLTRGRALAEASISLPA